MNMDIVRLADIPDLWWRTRGVVGVVGLGISLALAGGSAALIANTLRDKRLRPCDRGSADISASEHPTG
jgi:hypothetical protein